MSEFTYSNAEFDRYANEYEAALAQGLSISGEDKNYFARRRVEWLARCLRESGQQPARILDFGCGIGTSAPYLLDILGGRDLVGVDVSQMSLRVARQSHATRPARFELFAEYQPAGMVDLAFCNGVFHHIPPAERDAAVNYIYRALRPGGLFAFWENNPWNPGTRYVMSRIPFDRDAITLTPPEARRLLSSAGFESIQTDFLFIFPKALSWLRGLEPRVSRLPFGAQYQVMCRKPQRREQSSV